MPQFPKRYADTVARLRVPSGFAVRLFASGLDSPRLMSVGPDGHLYVADRGANAVIRLADADGDGSLDKDATSFDVGVSFLKHLLHFFYICSLEISVSFKS